MSTECQGSQHPPRSCTFQRCRTCKPHIACPKGAHTPKACSCTPPHRYYKEHTARRCCSHHSPSGTPRHCSSPLHSPCMNHTCGPPCSCTARPDTRLPIPAGTAPLTGAIIPITTPGKEVPIRAMLRKGRTLPGHKHDPDSVCIGVPRLGAHTSLKSHPQSALRTGPSNRHPTHHTRTPQDTSPHCSTYPHTPRSPHTASPRSPYTPAGPEPLIRIARPAKRHTVPRKAIPTVQQRIPRITLYVDTVKALPVPRHHPTALALHTRILIRIAA
eukprot:747150-Hanusia_phi.AAC.1